MEVQGGKGAMRKKFASEHGVSAACMQRMAKGASVEGNDLLGDAWFGYIKVKKESKTVRGGAFKFRHGQRMKYTALYMLLSGKVPL
jgi:hypothetical protein